MPGNAPHPKKRDRQEPQRHDRAERLADTGSALGLDYEQRDEDQHRNGKHIGREGGSHDVQSPQRREHGDSWGDRPVAIDQRGAKEAHHDDHRTMPALHPERQDAALAVIVDAHRDGYIFDRCHHDQRPDYKRQHAKSDRRVRSAAGQT